MQLKSTSTVLHALQLSFRELTLTFKFLNFVPWKSSQPHTKNKTRALEKYQTLEDLSQTSLSMGLFLFCIFYNSNVVVNFPTKKLRRKARVEKKCDFFIYLF